MELGQQEVGRAQLSVTVPVENDGDREQQHATTGAREPEVGRFTDQPRSRLRASDGDGRHPG